MVFGNDIVTVQLQQDSEMIELMAESLDKLGDSIQQSVNIINGAGGLNSSIKELSAVSLVARDNITKLYDAISKTPNLNKTSADNNFDGGFAKPETSLTDKSSKNKNEEFLGIKGQMKLLGAAYVGVKGAQAAGEFLNNTMINSPTSAAGQSDFYQKTLKSLSLGAPIVSQALEYVGKNIGERKINNNLYQGLGAISQATASDKIGFYNQQDGLYSRENMTNIFSKSAVDLNDARTKTNYAGMMGENLNSTLSNLNKLDSSLRNTAISLDQMNTITQANNISFGTLSTDILKFQNTGAYKANPTATLTAYETIKKERGMQAAGGIESYENADYFNQKLMDVKAQSIGFSSYTDAMNASPEDITKGLETLTGASNAKDAINMAKGIGFEDFAGLAGSNSSKGTADLVENTNNVSKDFGKDDFTKFVVDSAGNLSTLNEAIMKTTKQLSILADATKKANKD